MRIKLLYLFLSFFPFAIVAQSLEVYHGDQALKPGDEITLSTNDNSGMLTLDDLLVMNNSKKTLSILCAREIISEVNETKNSFSWANVEMPDDPFSSVPVRINAGAYSTSFISDYSPAGNSGITKIRYIFYDKDNSDDRVDFIVNYKSSSESDNLDQNNQVYFSPAYPNPAQNVVNFDYSMMQRHQNSKIVLYNLFGSIVKEIEITEIAGSLKTNTSDLTEGIYFYSLLINNESILTQKLVIKH